MSEISIGRNRVGEFEVQWHRHWIFWHRYAVVCGGLIYCYVPKDRRFAQSIADALNSYIEGEAKKITAAHTIERITPRSYMGDEKLPDA